MADDIVTRLRDQAEAPALAWLAEAADQIERLRIELDKQKRAHDMWFKRAYDLEEQMEQARRG